MNKRVSLSPGGDVSVEEQGSLGSVTGMGEGEVSRVAERYIHCKESG